MLKATEYEILRGLRANGRIKLPMTRQPVRVATLIDEAEFMKDQFLVHNKTVFLEDKFHDWDWLKGEFSYYTRVAEVADVVVVYALEDVSPMPRFDPESGSRLY